MYEQETVNLSIKNRWETYDEFGRRSIIFINTEYKETLLQ